MDNSWDNRSERSVMTYRSKKKGVDVPVRIAMRDLIVQLLDHLDRIPRVLECACGPGAEYEGFKKYRIPIQYTGIDISEMRLDIARRDFPEADFRVGDIRDLHQFAGGEFDLVYCKAVLEHLPSFFDVAYALHSMARVSSEFVAPIFFLPPGKKQRFSFAKASGEIISKNWYKHSDILAVMAGAGFDLVEMKKPDHNIIYLFQKDPN